MDDKHKEFIKINQKTLNEIFGIKLSELMTDVLDKPTDRDKMIDAINILRSWLREIDIIGKGQEIKPPTNFV